MNVLIIPEDFRKDQYILKPIIEKMLKAAGTHATKVRVCIDPLLGGVGEALKWDRISEVIDMHPMVQVFLLIVDRDGKPGRRASLDSLEEKANDKLSKQTDVRAGRSFFAENAWQEIEVWALAGIAELPKQWKWRDVRNEPNPKEIYFEKFAQQRGLLNEPGQGRITLGREAAKSYSRIRSLCPEDVASLEVRIKRWITE